jgi:hypothetical protein
MLERCGELNLAIETIHAHFECEVGRKHFDDHAARETRFLGDEDAAHAATAQLFLDAVGVTQRCLQSIG